MPDGLWRCAGCGAALSDDSAELRLCDRSGRPCIGWRLCDGCFDRACGDIAGGDRAVYGWLGAPARHDRGPAL